MVAISFSQMDDTGYWRSPKLGDRFKGKEISANQDQSFGRQPSTEKNDVSNAHNVNSQRDSQRHMSDMITKTDESRFLVWVDAVGGYLVCTSDEVVLGQAVPESHVDIPILGDLARKHLKLNRTQSGYLLEPFGYVKVNGLVIEEKTLLRDGDLINLTGGIEIRFSKAHPLSATARLDFQSTHRTQPWSDAVLLMAESCVLGPNLRNHVVCRNWSEDIVFFRKNKQLFCKSLGAISVDGRAISGKTELRNNSHIEGEDFSMTLEPLTS